MRSWVALFVDFLVSKHGLAGALHGDSQRSDALHDYFVGRLVPVCDSLLKAALESVDTAPTVDTYDVLKGVGNLCIGAASDAQYESPILVQLFIRVYFPVEFADRDSSPRRGEHDRKLPPIAIGEVPTGT